MARSVPRSPLHWGPGLPESSCIPPALVPQLKPTPSENQDCPVYFSSPSTPLGKEKPSVNTEESRLLGGLSFLPEAVCSK